MRYLRILLTVIMLLNLPAIGEGSINSDIRIEIMSQIKIYEEEIFQLSKKMEKLENIEEKKLILHQIELLKEKIKRLKKTLERYENSYNSIG